jgi:hydrogenase maturation protein HypF
MQFSKQHTIPIMLRRSRGWAPGYHPCNLPTGKKSLLAMGAELKGSFAISHQQKCFISQYLGDQGYYDAQQSYRQTLDHLSSLLQFEPDNVLIDAHPAYEISKFGRALAEQKNIPITSIQHHEAHIAAVLAENNLLETNEPVLGIAWDGTGYGHDGQIWGGEFIRYQKGHFERIAHLAYFPMIMGDKMSREPRLSALALAHHLLEAKNMLRQKFNKNEWTLYNAMLHMPAAVLSTSSMGRLLDGIASLLGIADTSNYEGEAAMLLQAVAEQGNILESTIYPIPLVDGIIHWQPMIAAIVEDVSQQKAISTIALNVHLSLAHMIVEVANHFATPAIACSGGVMQNALLMDALKSHIQPHQTLYVHQQLSPNDECIAYGQLAWYHAQQISAQKKATAYSHFTSEKETYSTIDK